MGRKFETHLNGQLFFFFFFFFFFYNDYQSMFYVSSKQGDIRLIFKI